MSKEMRIWRIGYEKTRSKEGKREVAIDSLYDTAYSIQFDLLFFLVVKNVLFKN